MGGPSAEREVSLMSGNGVLGGAARKGRRRAPVRSGRARPVGPAARRLRPRVHRAARPLRRGRHGAGRARDARDSVHRQRRDGVGARDGQVAHQARLARERHPDAALSRRRRAHRLDARRGRARAAADREARARRLDHRHHQGREGRSRRACAGVRRSGDATTRWCWSRNSSRARSSRRRSSTAARCR